MADILTFIPFGVKDIKEFSKSSNVADIIVFTADWCGSCVIFEKILQKLVLAYEGKIGFYIADFNKYKALATSYGILNPPALLYTRHGKVLDKLEGTSSGSEIVQKLEALLRDYI